VRGPQLPQCNASASSQGKDPRLREVAGPFWEGVAGLASFWEASRTLWEAFNMVGLPPSRGAYGGPKDVPWPATFLPLPLMSAPLAAQFKMPGVRGHGGEGPEVATVVEEEEEEDVDGDGGGGEGH